MDDRGRVSIAIRHVRHGGDKRDASGRRLRDGERRGRRSGRVEADEREGDGETEKGEREEEASAETGEEKE